MTQIEFYDLKVREDLEGRFGVLDFDNWKYLAYVHREEMKEYLTYFPLTREEFDKPQNVKRSPNSPIMIETISEDFWNNELKDFAEAYKDASRIH